MNLLTILIPTRDRPNFLQFHLEYHKNNRSNYQLIIADGSFDNEVLIKNNNIINNYKKYLNIRYFLDKNYYFERVKKALKFVKTEYCLLTADDDLYSFDFLRKGLDILEKNSKITSVYGQISSVFLNNLNSKFYYQNSFLYNYRLSKLSLNSSDLDKRILDITKSYLSSTFFLQRKEHLMKKIEAIELIRKRNFGKQKLDISKEFKIIFLYEMISSMYTVCFGRSIFIKKYMLCRLYHTKNGGGRNFDNLTNILFSNFFIVYSHLHKCTKISLKRSKQITAFFILNMFITRFNVFRKETINVKFLSNFSSRILDLKIGSLFEKIFFNKFFNAIRSLFSLDDKDKTNFHKFIKKNIKLLRK